MKLLKIILSILITIILIVTICFFYNTYTQNRKNKTIIKTIEKIEISNDKTFDNIPSESILNKENIIGILEIPKLNLKAPICNSTDEENLKKYIGHFEHTSIFNGNVALASHAFGFQYNYFSDINKLNIDDIIIYKTLQGTKEYKVDKLLEIQENDWSYLNNTINDTLTLITCIKNKSNFRLCVKASVR